MAQLTENLPHGNKESYIHKDIIVNDNVSTQAVRTSAAIALTQPSWFVVCSKIRLSSLVNM